MSQLTGALYRLDGSSFLLMTNDIRMIATRQPPPASVLYVIDILLLLLGFDALLLAKNQFLKKYLRGKTPRCTQTA